MQSATSLIEAKLQDKATHGIHINVKHQDFVGQILSGEKTIETRDTNSLKPYINKRVGLIATGIKGDRHVYGFATVGEPLLYKTKKHFDGDYSKNKVGKESPYHISNSRNKEKYGYPLTQVEVLKNPRRLQKGPSGIISRKINF